MRLLTIVIGAALLIAGDARAQTPSSLVIRTAVGPRTALIFRVGTSPGPTLLVLHGANGTGEAVARDSGFAQAAARYGFNAVFPNGIDRRWHYGPAVRGPDPGDVAFLRDLVGRLVRDGVADPRRVYLAGISNGGMMAFVMACEAGSLFAGIATIIANMPADERHCDPPPLPYVMVNGTADPTMPYAGGTVGLRQAGGQVWGIEQTAAYLAGVDGCTGAPAAQALPSAGTGGSRVTRMAWTGCKPGTSVTLFRVENGGHTIPGTAPPRNPAFGATNQDFSAAEAILDIFAGRSSHPLTGSRTRFRS